MDAPVAIDADQTSITVAWKEPPNGAVSYELQMLSVPPASSSPPEPEGGEKQASEGQRPEGESSWTSLSSSLKQTVVKKKNLSAGATYTFRVRTRDKIDWGPYSPPAELKTLSAGSKQCTAPKLTSRGADWLAVTWDAVEGAQKYHLQMRVEGELQWQDLATVGGTAAKKKHLKQGTYFFRVRPLMEGEEGEGGWAYSPSSEACVTAVLAPGLRSLLGPSLLAKADGTTVTVDELAGKVVGVYASAHWCGPCRNFTPVLSQFYDRVAKKRGRPFEIVFASADHDEKGMMSYYGEHMPWLAMPYDADQREAFMATYQVRSIPRLIIFGADGRVLEDNAVGPQFLTDQALSSWERGTPSIQQPAGGGGGHCGNGSGGGGGGCCGDGK